MYEFHTYKKSEEHWAISTFAVGIAYWEHVNQSPLILHIFHRPSYIDSVPIYGQVFYYRKLCIIPAFGSITFLG